MFKKLKMKTRLMLIIAIPILGILLFCARQGLETLDRRSRILTLQELSQLAVHSSAFVHEMQKERGMSAGYIGSSGQKFREALRTQWGDTDRKYSELQSFLKAADASVWGSDITAPLDHAIRAGQRLQTVRSGVAALSTPLSEVLAFYSGTNATVLDMISKMSGYSIDLERASLLGAYTNFLKAKERAGIERAVLTNTFAADAFAPGMFQKFTSLVSAQNSYLDVFLAFATEDMKQFYNKTVVSSEASQMVNQMREVAFSNAATGGFGTPAERWFKTITGKINLLKEVENRFAEQLHGDLASTASAEIAMILTLIAVVALSTVLVLWVINGITRHFANITEELIDQEKLASEASGSLEEVSHSVTATTTEQAAAVQETVASMAEMSSMLDRTAGFVNESLELAQKVRTKTEEGGRTMEQMVSSMESIQEANDQLQEMVRIIDEISAKTGVINDIVFKTQLLSFNASIEAARAGQHGRGFAVVAEEVGTLAEVSGKAAQEIQLLLQDSQTHVGKIVETTKTRVSEGEHVSKEALDTFNEIAQDVFDISSKVQGISSAAKEQESGIQQTNDAMTQMDQASQKNSNMAHSVSRLAAGSNQQSQKLHNIVKDMQRLVFGQDDSGGSQRSQMDSGAGEAYVDLTSNMAVKPRGSLNDIGDRLVHQARASLNELSESGENGERPGADDDSFTPYAH
jgi:methyl-accepting chemotaxis protein